MAFLLYLVGLVVFVAGLGWLATALGAAQGWVALAALVLLALGIVAAIVRARMESRY
jgi:positive regulator of sigma E activity